MKKQTASDFLKKVGSNMREICKSRKMTQSEVAKALNMAKVSYIERGQIATSLKTLFNIVSILDVSPARLLLDNGEIFLTKKDIISFYA